MAKPFQLHGINSLQKSFSRLRMAIDKKGVEDDVGKVAEKLRGEIEKQIDRRTGKKYKPFLKRRLKQALTTERFDKKIKGIANFSVWIDYKKAPDAITMEYGSRKKDIKGKRFMRVAVWKFTRENFSKEMEALAKSAIDEALKTWG